MPNSQRESDSLVVRLVQKARSGDDKALDQLFGACRNYLSIVAQSQLESWLRSKVDASDLVQQTLLEAHRDFRRFAGHTEEEWLAWLRRILAHNAADFVRQYGVAQKRRAKMEAPLGRRGDDGSAHGAPEPVDPLESPSRQLARQEEKLRLADALAKLSADHRDVIMLRNLQRLPFDEVADRMGRSRAAAQMLWMRAMAKLKQMLADSSWAAEAAGD